MDRARASPLRGKLERLQGMCVSLRSEREARASASDQNAKRERAPPRRRRLLAPRVLSGPRQVLLETALEARRRLGGAFAEVPLAERYSRRASRAFDRPTPYMTPIARSASAAARRRRACSSAALGCPRLLRLVPATRPRGRRASCTSVKLRRRREALIEVLLAQPPQLPALCPTGPQTAPPALRIMLVKDVVQHAHIGAC
jgi:hypothetical protein